MKLSHYQSPMYSLYYQNIFRPLTPTQPRPPHKIPPPLLLSIDTSYLPSTNLGSRKRKNTKEMQTRWSSSRGKSSPNTRHLDRLQTQHLEHLNVTCSFMVHTKTTCIRIKRDIRHVRYLIRNGKSTHKACLNGIIVLLMKYGEVERRAITESSG